MGNWDDIKDEVEQNGNVLTVTMERLRDAAGNLKLGTRVATTIKSELAGMGLGHVPQQLPRFQHELVRLYKNGTPVGELIATVLTPGEEADSRLREQLDGETDYSEIIREIRELVGE